MADTITFFRYCELTQLGGLLDSKGYGIALPKGDYISRIGFHHPDR